MVELVRMVNKHGIVSATWKFETLKELLLFYRLNGSSSDGACYVKQALKNGSRRIRNIKKILKEQNA